MQLSKGTIVYIDFIDKDSKTRLDDELKKLTGMQGNPKSWNWVQMPGSGGTHEEWTFPTVPSNLYFFGSIRVRITLFYTFPFVYAILVEGVLSNETLAKLQTLNDSEASTLVQKYRDELWKFCKENIHGLAGSNVPEVFSKKGRTVNNFVFKIEHVKEILGDAWKELSQSVHKIRDDVLLRRYHANTAGIISLCDISTNHLTILAQSNFVFYNGRYDFSGISMFEFFDHPEALEGPTFLGGLHADRIVKLLLIHLWVEYRLEQISKWKKDVENLSSEIKKLENQIGKPDMETVSLSVGKQKGLFLIDYASILDEYRYIGRYVKFEEELLKSESWKEIPVLESKNLPSIQYGIMYELQQEISEYSARIKDEFTILKDQYDTLTGHMSDLTNLAIASSTLKLARSNTKLQWVLVALTGVLIALTAILAFKH